jgi:hypothetical protein
MIIKPLFNHILIKPAEKKQILVSDKKSFCDYGEVIDKGPDVKYVKVGEIIAYTVWGLNSIGEGNEKQYLVPEDERFVLGTITL